MPELTLVIDATRAEQGAQKFEASVRRIENAAARAAARVSDLGGIQDGAANDAKYAARQYDLFGNAVEEAGDEAKAAARDVDKLGKETKQTGDEATKAARKNRQLSDSYDLLKRAVTAVAFVAVARGFARLSDAATNIENRLRLVTASTQELATVQAVLFQQSQEARGSFEGQAELYQRVARSAGQLGRTTGETLQVTEAVAKAITISGVSAEAANAAIVQLGQGLSAGALRGDELRSVLEQTPRLAQAIAAGLGVQVGQLRELGERGELTAQRVFEALLAQLPQLQSEFAQLEPTFGQAGQTLENSLINATDKLNEAVGISQALSLALLDTSEVIDTTLVPGLVDGAIELKGLAVAFIATIDQAIIKTQLFTNDLLQGIQSVRDEGGFFDDFLSAAAVQSEALNKNIDELPGILSPLARLVTSPLLVAADAARNLNDATEDRVDLEAERKDLVTELNASEEGAQKTINDLVEKRLELQKKIAAASQGDTAGRAGGAAATTGGEDVAAIPREVATEIQRLVDSTATPLEQFQARLERLRELRDIAPDTVTFEVFQRGVQQAVDAFTQADPAIIAYNERLERARSLTESVISPQEAYNATVREYTDLLNANLISVETFNRLQEQARDKLDSTDEALKRQNDLLAEGEALRLAVRTEDEVRLDTLARYQELLEANAISQETFNRAVADLEGTSQRAFASLEQFGRQAAETINTDLTDLFLNPTKEGFEDFADSAIDSLQRIAAEALKNLILTQLFNAIGGPVGGALSSAFGLTARANGGPALAGRPYLVGEREPEVFVPRQSGTVLNGEQMAQLSPTINNTVVVDTKGFTEALNTPRGSKDLINAISVNRTAIKGALK